MDYQLNTAGPSQAELDRTFTDAMGRVYLWMTGGLILTAVIAMYIASNQELQRTVVGNGLVFFGLIGAQLGLVLLISFAINKLSP